MSGVACLRRAIQIARENDDVDGLGYAYANLADHLNLRGRTAEALEVAQEGLAATPRRIGRLHDWMMLTISELEFEVGNWKAARSNLGAWRLQLIGVLLIFRLVREADIGARRWRRGAGGAMPARGRAAGRTIRPSRNGSGSSARCSGELRRRRRDLLGARAAVAQALDRLEVCTDDVVRIARVTGIGVRIEADIAQRARDLREKAQERDAIARARIHMTRLRAAAQEGGPVESAWRQHRRGRVRPRPRAR